MARRTSKYSRQRQLEQELKQGLDDLKATRQILRNAADEALKGNYPRAGTFDKIPKRDWAKLAKIEKTFGLYEPLGKTLTSSRKRSIRSHWQQLEYLMENSAFAAYPPKTPRSTKQKISSTLRKVYPKTRADERFSGERAYLKNPQLATKRGIWVPTSDRQIGPLKAKNIDRTQRIVVQPNIGTLKFDRDTGLWAVQVRRKTKAGVYAQELRYIAGSEALDIKQRKLQRRFEKLPGLKRNQRLRFIIGTNESRRTFRNMEELFRYASRYRRDDQARATFLNELIIEAVQKGEPRYKWRGKGRRRKQIKEVWTKPIVAFRASNYHEVDTDFIMDMYQDMETDDDEG